MGMETNGTHKSPIPTTHEREEQLTSPLLNQKSEDPHIVTW